MKDKLEPDEERNIQYDYREDHSGHSVDHLHRQTVCTLHWLLEKLFRECLRETETTNHVRPITTSIPCSLILSYNHPL